MSELQRISNNTIFSFLSLFFRLLSNVILFWIIARFYGKEIFGQFSIAQTFASIFVLFADFGLDMLLTTELPRKLVQSKEIFQKLFSMKVLFTIITFIVILGVSSFGDFSPDVRQLIIIFCFYATFTTLTTYLYALFQGFERFEYETKVSFGLNLSMLIVIMLLIFLEQNIIIISFAFVTMRFFGLVLALYYARCLLPSITFKLKFKDIRSILNKVIVFGLFLIFGNLYFLIDTILLAFFKGEESVGIYQAVFKLIMLPLFIPQIFVNSLMPTLSRMNTIDIIKWEKLGQALYKVLNIVAIPICITIIMFAEEIIGIIYSNQEYAEAIPILRIFAFIVFVRFFAETHGLMLTTSQRQKTRMYIVIVATILNIALNIILIPIYSVQGAAFVSLITNLFVAVLFLVFTKSFLNKWGRTILRPQLILNVIVIVISFYFLKSFDMWYLCWIPLIAYFVLIYKNILSQEEKKYLSEIKILRIRLVNR